jgi:hypothetical protein
MVQFVQAARSFRNLVLLTLSTCGLLFVAADVAAEIVIDDFVDDLRIDLPEDNLDHFITPSIGDLAATRVISAGGVQTRPNGFLDVNQTVPSALAVQMPTTMHTGTTPAAWVLIEYGLAPPFGGVDLSETGTNDAVVLEFDQLIADIPLHRVYVLATDGVASSSYINTYSPIPQRTDPFSLVFSFDAFQIARGAPVPDFDFSFVRELHVLVELALFDPGLPEQLGFQMTVTRIRVGTMVPEPSTANAIGWLTIVSYASLRCRSLKGVGHVKIIGTREMCRYLHPCLHVLDVDGCPTERDGKPRWGTDTRGLG